MSRRRPSSVRAPVTVKKVSLPVRRQTIAAMNRSSRGVPTILIPLLLSAPLGAAELVVRDLSAGIELLPTGFTYTLTDPTGSRTGQDSFSSGYGAFVGSVWSIAGPGDSSGFLLGGDLTYATYAYTNGGAYTTYGGRLLGGYAYAISDRWTLSAVVDAGAGSGTFNIVGTSAFKNYTANGLYYSYAARLGASFAVNDSLLVDVDAGYRNTQSNLSAGGTDLTLTGTGICAAIGFRYRFSSSPSPLE